MSKKTDPVENQKVDPDGDFDFKDEEKLDKTVPPVGDFDKPTKGK